MLDGLTGRKRWPLLAAAYLGAAFFGSAFTSTAASAAPAGCDERCLRAVMDGYLSALMAHDPKGLAVTQDVRFTENGVQIALGQGLWTTASGAYGHKIYVPDPQSQSIGFMGSLNENGKNIYLAARIKVRDNSIAEVETTVARGKLVNQTVIPAPASLAELTPEKDRLPREKLIELSGKYFDAISQNEGALAPFGPLCERTENGMHVTNVSFEPGMVPLDCATGITKMSPVVTASHRRVLAVDEARNIVMWVAVFDMAGVVTPQLEAWRKTATPGQVAMLDQLFMPNSGPLMELFRIRDGKIAEIEAVFYPHPLPYGFTPGWDDHSE